MENLIQDFDKIPKGKKLVIFDLDGTLTESKTDMDSEMAGLLGKLLENKKVAVIGGGGYQQFQNQFVSKLQTSPELLRNLFLFPTTSTRFYRFDQNEWQLQYSEDLSDEQKKEIPAAFEKAFAELHYVHPEKIYGELLEDRGAQVSFSFLGQKAPLELKIKWRDENTPLKMKVAEIVQKYLPDMEVRAAGYTTIDVTYKGIDKEYGLKQISESLGISFDDMLFVGDALFEGGNDSPALRTGIPCFSVKNPAETKQLILSIISLKK